MIEQLTTPFGRRRLSRAMILAQRQAQALPQDAAVHKWKLFRALSEARDVFGVSDRSLSVLHALLSFHQETVLTGAEGLIVFPSNQELSIRAHGMAAATLRRHLAALVETGLVIRRDSPNGKRYARRGGDGAVEQAFGFDLAPLVARAEEIENAAEEVLAERRAVIMLREKVTLHRRDIAKTLAAAVEAGGEADPAFAVLAQRHRDLSGRLPRSTGRGGLEPLEADLLRLRAEAEAFLLKLVENEAKNQNMNASESHSGRDNQNSNPDPFDLEPDFRGSRADGPVSLDRVIDSPVLKSSLTPATAGQGARPWSLGLVLQACPDLLDWARDGVTSWSDLARVAELVRPALGVSPSAWDDAKEALGPHEAAILIAAILQKGEAVRSPGGYLRVLVAKARDGQFSLGPILMSLLKAQAQTQRKSA